MSVSGAENPNAGSNEHRRDQSDGEDQNQSNGVGSETPPVPHAVVNQSSAHPKKQKTQAQRKESRERITLYILVAAVVAALLPNIYYYKQLGVARRTIEMEQRAWIILTTLKTETFHVGNAISVTVHLVNSGKTPAKHIIARTVAEWVRNGDIPSFRGSVPGLIDELGILFPNEAVDIPAVMLKTAGSMEAAPLTRAMIEDFLAGRVYLATYGTVGYEDVFNVPHWIKFCGWGAGFPPGGTYTARQCSSYNDIDNNWTGYVGPRPF